MENLLLNTDAQVSIKDIVIALGVGTVLGFILQLHFMKFGKSANNRSQFGSIFIYIILTTALIISLIKTSLALSLGLVGALSIVRFRTPIKEPEELAYLFIAIAIGLGLGANQTLITVIAISLILVVTGVLRFFSTKERDQGVYLSYEGSVTHTNVDEIKEYVAKLSSSLLLKRIDQTGDRVSVLMLLNIDPTSSPSELFKGLQAKYKEGQFTMVDRDHEVNF